jgi:hypothetical protein
LSALAAKHWGLPATRMNVISDGADDPDEYEAGARRYTTGALKYALDRYAQWSSQY